MQIGISTSVIQRGKSGIGQYLFALLRAFLPYTDKHQFTLFALEADRELIDFAGQQMRIVTVPERYRSPVRNIFWHQARLPALVRELNLNVLHIPSYRRMLGHRPCPLVATIHDLAPFRVANKYDWKRTFYGRVVAKGLARRQDEIIAISESTASDIVQFFGLPRNRISVIHNGLDRARFSPGPRDAAKAEVQRRRGITRPFFLYVARLEHPGKNHVRLISAFNRFKTATGSDWNLVFGGSDWHGAEAIHAAIRQSPFAPEIHALGFVPNDDLPMWYRAADAFVYPSLYEGFGMPPTEAMASGCPVICSDRGSLGEVAAGAAAIIDPESTGSMATQLARLAGDESLRDRLRAAGFERAKDFDWNQAAAETLKVYERAAARRRDPIHSEGTGLPMLTSTLSHRAERNS